MGGDTGGERRASAKLAPTLAAGAAGFRMARIGH
jgi:hypothetical protein